MRMNTLKPTGKSFLLILLAASLLFTSCTKKSDDSQNNNFNETATLLSAPFYNASVSSTYIAPVNLFIDSKDNKWIVSTGTNGSWILRYDGTTWDKFTSSNIPVPLQDEIFVHTEDSEGGIYFTSLGTSVHYLIKYKNGVWTYWNITNIVNADKIFFNKADNLLYFYSADVVKKAALTANFASSGSYTTVTSDAIPYSLFMDATLTSGSFYITSDNASIKVGTNGSVVNLTPLDGGLRFSKITASASGNIYATVNSSSDKIYKLNGSTWSLVPYTNGSVSSTLINQITIDNNENIFVQALDLGGSTTQEQGVGKIVNGSIKYYKLNNDKILTTAPIAVDKNNVKWVAVYSGLVKIAE